MASAVARHQMFLRHACLWSSESFEMTRCLLFVILGFTLVHEDKSKVALCGQAQGSRCRCQVSNAYNATQSCCARPVPARNYSLCPSLRKEPAFYTPPSVPGVRAWQIGRRRGAGSVSRVLERSRHRETRQEKHAVRP
jgi:hypothetical protein